MSYCEDCGCRMYGGMCTNCDEECFIADQYRSMGESVPEALAETEAEQRARRTRNSQQGNAPEMQKGIEQFMKDKEK